MQPNTTAPTAGAIDESREAKFMAACRAFRAACIEYDPTIQGLVSTWAVRDETSLYDQAFSGVIAHRSFENRVGETASYRPIHPSRGGDQ